jgi:hypothetical protein
VLIVLHPQFVLIVLHPQFVFVMLLRWISLLSFESLKVQSANRKCLGNFVISSFCLANFLFPFQLAYGSSYY